MKILVVEDDIPFSSLMERFVKPLVDAFPRSELMIVHTLESALEEIARTPSPDITILDPNLPPHGMEDTFKHLDSIEDRTALVVVSGFPKSEIEKQLAGRETPFSTKLDLVGNWAILDDLIYRAVRLFQKRGRAIAEADLEIIRGINRKADAIKTG